MAASELYACLSPKPTRRCSSQASSPAQSASHRVPFPLFPRQQVLLSGAEGESSSEAQTHTACSPPWAAPRPKPSQGQTLGAPVVCQAQSAPVAQTPSSLASLAEGGWTGSLGGVILVGPPPPRSFRSKARGPHVGDLKVLWPPSGGSPLRLGGERLREGVTSEVRGDGTTSTVCLPADPLPDGAAEAGRAPAPPTGTWQAAAPCLFHLSQHLDPAHTACFLPHSPAKVHGESTSFSR